MVSIRSARSTGRRSIASDIVAEHHALDGIQFWFDELRIVGPALTAVLDEASSQPAALALAANYPNPFNATTAIRYALPVAGPGCIWRFML